ncbi:MAG: vitamin B12 transporter [Halioglobus sp.]|jgi:vitamin B12 transporter
MKNLFPLSVLAIACSNSLAALADNKLEEIIIISSRVEMPLREIGTSVSVVTGKEIEQRGYNSLFEILRSQPAIGVSNTGGPGKTTSLRIRGEEGYRTLVLIDGIDVSDVAGTQSGPKFEQLLSNGIERVEILRGPQGLMFGADAGGVVNISTQTQRTGLNGTVSAEAGRYGSEQLAAQLGGGNESVDFFLSATDFETDGFNALIADTSPKDSDGYENTTVHGRLGWNVNESLRIQVVARDVSGEDQFDDCFTVDTFSPTNLCSDDYDHSAWRASADLDLGSFTHQLSYSGNTTEREFFSEESLSFFADGELESWNYLGSYSSGEDFRLIYGAELENSSIDDGTFDTDRDQSGYYAEYQGRFNDQIFVTAGARYDDNDDFGTHTSYRLSGAYLFAVATGELKLRGTYGTGFRAPSLYEISYNGGAFASPPASETSLKEENTQGFDIGLSWALDSGSFLEVVYFNQEVEDEIFFDLVNFSGYLQGDGDTRSKGVELIGELSLSESLTITANYTYNDTENSDGELRIRRPKQLANLGVNWKGLDSKLVLGLNARGSYDSENSIRGQRSDLDDYTVLDINASYEFVPGLQLYARMENLFDKEYSEIPAYNTSGAAAYAGVRYTF